MPSLLQEAWLDTPSREDEVGGCSALRLGLPQSPLLWLLARPRAGAQGALTLKAFSKGPGEQKTWWEWFSEFKEQLKGGSSPAQTLASEWLRFSLGLAVCCLGEAWVQKKPSGKRLHGSLSFSGVEEEAAQDHWGTHPLWS